MHFSWRHVFPDLLHWYATFAGKGVELHSILHRDNLNKNIARQHASSNKHTEPTDAQHTTLDHPQNHTMPRILFPCRFETLGRDPVAGGCLG